MRLNRPETDVMHGMADIEAGLRRHYVAAGAGKRTAVLLHGFPQTWWEWRQVIPITEEIASMHIVLFGAGNIGGRIAAEALARGHRRVFYAIDGQPRLPGPRRSARKGFRSS